ncbi:MAG: glucose-6-phosphate isomerase [Rikenellaceae bacterium]
MKKKFQLDYKKILGFVTQQDVTTYLEKALSAYRMVREESGAGADMMGWKTLPSSITMEQIKEIKRCAAYLSEKCEIVVVIGVGGSYIGAKAVVEALNNPFAVHRPRKRPHIIWTGNNLSGDFAYELKEMLATKEIGVIVISKSGTTLEPALSFRYIRKIVEDKYGRTEAAKRIIAVTDETNGALRELTQAEGYASFTIPNNVGGRFSVFTPVGLLPIALSGIDIEELMEGAYYIEEILSRGEISPEENYVLQYAAIRNLLYDHGKKIELMASFEPKLFAFAQWWQQLFGESEGKKHRGLFPSQVIYSTDLHSIGQYVQDGERVLFETFIGIEKWDNDVIVRKDKDDMDGLNYVSGKTFGEINRLAQSGVTLAHTDGGVPNMTITMEKLDAETLGALIYFFEYSCAISAYMLGEINPFNQDGVEAYKNNMFALLERDGYEELNEKLKDRL